MRLRFWTRESLKLSAIVILASLFYSIFLWGMTGDSHESPLFTGMVFLISAGGIYLGIFTFSAYYSYLSVAVAFGSTRKEALAGIRLFRLIYIGVHTLAGLILAVIHYGGFRVELLLLILLAVLLDLLFSTVGMLMGIVNIRRSGKTAVWVFAGFMGLLSAVMIWIVFAVMSGVDNAVIWTVIALAVLIPVVHILCLKPEKKAVYTCGIKM